MGQTGTCPEALESLKVKSFYGDFADGFWNFGEWDSVLTILEVPHPHAGLEVGRRHGFTNFGGSQ